MSKGSKLQRAIDYFREAPLDEARVAHQLVREVMDERFKSVQPKVKIKRQRRGKLTVAGKEVPAGESVTVGATASA